MKKLKMTFLIILTLIVIAGVALRLVVPRLTRTSVATGVVTVDDQSRPGQSRPGQSRPGQSRPGQSRPGQSRLGDCPDTPNCQNAELIVSKPASEVIGTLATLITSQDGTTIITQDERYLHATFTSRIMAFTDDVEFLVSDDGQSVQVRSASRIGKSDLGANAERVELLRSLTTGLI